MEKKKPITCAELQIKLNDLEDKVSMLATILSDNTDTISSILETLESDVAENPVTYFINNLLEKTNIQTVEELKDFIITIEKVNKGAALALILRSIALILDEQYPDNIKKATEIYVFSTLDGKIYKQDAARIGNYQYFAGFRTLEDATFAVTMANKIREFLKNVSEKAI